MSVVSVALALVACFLFSLSAYVQQGASTAAPGRTGGVAGLERLMLALLRNPVWALGATVNFVGFVVQAVALHKGSVSEVQPLMPTQLLFALGLASARARHWPGVRDWSAGIAICAGITLVLTSEHTHPGNTHTSAGRVLAVVLCSTALIALLVALAHSRTPVLAAAFTATAAGCCFATTAVFLKLVADRVAAEGIDGMVSHPALYGMLASTTVGTVLTQAALAAGPLPWTMAAMTIANPVIGYAFACMAFEARPPSAPVAAVAVFLLVAGVIGLATTRSKERWKPVLPEPDYA